MLPGQHREPGGAGWFRFIVDDIEGSDEEASALASRQDSASQSVTFQDGEYLPGLLEAAALSASFASGSYDIYPVITESVSEAVSQVATFQSGVYLLATVIESQSESSTLAATFQNGVYTLIVIVNSQTEASQMTATFQSGSYDLKVIVAPSQTENTSLAATFQSGAYTLA